MTTFFFLMQHKPSSEQLEAARKLADRIVALTPPKPEDQVEGVEYAGAVKLLNVPDLPTLGDDWFVTQALEIEAAVGGIKPGDTVQVMGQPQLANAVNALAHAHGAGIVESVTARESVDVLQPDGSTSKTAVFRFKGFRPVYKF